MENSSALRVRFPGLFGYLTEFVRIFVFLTVGLLKCWFATNHFVCQLDTLLCVCKNFSMFMYEKQAFREIYLPILACWLLGLALKGSLVFLLFLKKFLNLFFYTAGSFFKKIN